MNKKLTDFNTEQVIYTFIRFLKDKNLFIEFITEINRDHLCTSTYNIMRHMGIKEVRQEMLFKHMLNVVFPFMVQNNRCDFVDVFVWTDTIKGFKYWQNINHEAQNFVRQKLGII